MWRLWFGPSAQLRRDPGLYGCNLRLPQEACNTSIKFSLSKGGPAATSFQKYGFNRNVQPRCANEKRKYLLKEMSSIDYYSALCSVAAITMQGTEPFMKHPRKGAKGQVGRFGILA